jgi:SNF2 family DNA or RNA helicase
MIALNHQALPKLQATYVPSENGIAWWGVPDIPAQTRRAGLPVGRAATLRLANVVAHEVRPADVEAFVCDLKFAVPALAACEQTFELDASALGWRQASQTIVSSSRLAAPAEVEVSLDAVSSTLPPAGHAVLNAEETAIMAPEVLIAHFRSAYNTLETLLGAGLNAELRPYQAHGITWLVDRADRGVGALLADEMGLGKTLQAIGLLTARAAPMPHLVVCPTSLVGNWIRELARFAPQLRVLPHHGPNRSLPSEFTDDSVVVTSYPLLRSDPALTSRRWEVVVFDEAQQLKNPDALVTRAAANLEAACRVAMTGTPVENHLEELWSIFSTTNPDVLGTRARFRQRFAAPIQQRGSSTAAAALATITRPYLMRRTKSDVASELPPRLNSTVVCSLTEEQVRLYQASVDRAFSTGFGAGIGRSGRILALLTELKQICNHPAQFLGDHGPEIGRSGKFDRATEMLAEIARDGERALVFTQYRTMGTLLASGIGAALGLQPVPFLHGGLTPASRDELVRSFQEDEEAPPVLILSLRAAGVGLNLTRASHVLHYDRWWNPAVEEQATARAHRIGQQRTLNVYTLLAAGTVEEHIERMHVEKRGVADSITGDPITALTTLPDQRLREMLDLHWADRDW